MNMPELADLTLGPSLFIAFAGGVLSFLSPCVLPIVPPYLAYIAGTTIPSDKAARPQPVMLTAIFFVLGLSTVFLLLGLAASAAGQFLLAWQRQFTIISGLVIIAFGLNFLGLLRIPLLSREARLSAPESGGTAVGAYVLGLAFAFGWTPCIGPILGAILALAAQEASPAQATLLLAIYAAGLGVPFLLAAASLNRAARLTARLRPHMVRIEQAMGLLLVLTGVMMVSGSFTALAYWLLENVPILGNAG